MRMIRLLIGLGVLSAIASIGAAWSTGPATVHLEVLAPPVGVTSVPGNGSVTLRWQASNFGEGREGFAVYQASGRQASTPGETIPPAFGGTAVATVIASQGSGAFSATITGLANGATYSFLVVATKENGATLSRPSKVISDTPHASTLRSP